MTRRERVLKAIKHQNSDICPYNIDLTTQAHDNLISFGLSDVDIENFGNHLTGTSYGWQDEIQPGYFKDIFGVVWNKTGADKDIGVIEGLVLPEPTLQGFKLPEIDEKRFRTDIEDMIANADDKAIIVAIGFSMFERAWTLRGMENVLMDMLCEAGFLHELLDKICDFNLKLMDIALEYPLDGFHFGDDWGQQKGTIMGQTHWREFIKPRVAKMYAKAKSKGLFVSQHSCGDISDIFGDLIDIGLQMYQTFQPEIYDLKTTKATIGKNLTFWGGISTQRALPYLKPKEVKQLAWDTIKIMGENGGYIAAPTHAVPADVPAENIIALVEAFKEQKV
jgi:uroporphyrinogen decarboxylase